MTDFLNTNNSGLRANQLPAPQQQKSVNENTAVNDQVSANNSQTPSSTISPDEYFKAANLAASSNKMSINTDPSAKLNEALKPISNFIATEFPNLSAKAQLDLSLRVMNRQLDKT